jgi:hypothetical protein
MLVTVYLMPLGYAAGALTLVKALGLNSEEHPNRCINDQPVKIGTSAQHVKSRVESVLANLLWECSYHIRRSSQECGSISHLQL